MTNAEEQLVKLYCEHNLRVAEITNEYKYKYFNLTLLDKEDILSTLISGAYDLAKAEGFAEEFISMHNIPAAPRRTQWGTNVALRRLQIGKNDKVTKILVETLARGFLCVLLNWKDGFDKFYSRIEAICWNAAELTRDEAKEIIKLIINKASEDERAFNAFYKNVILPNKIKG